MYPPIWAHHRIRFNAAAGEIHIRARAVQYWGYRGIDIYMCAIDLPSHKMRGVLKKALRICRKSLAHEMRRSLTWKSPEKKREGGRIRKAQRGRFILYSSAEGSQLQLVLKTSVFYQTPSPSYSCCTRSRLFYFSQQKSAKWLTICLDFYYSFSSSAAANIVIFS